MASNTGLAAKLAEHHRKPLFFYGKRMVSRRCSLNLPGKSGFLEVSPRQCLPFSSFFGGHCAGEDRDQLEADELENDEDKQLGSVGFVRFVKTCESHTRNNIK